MQLSLTSLSDLNWRAAEIQQAIWTELKWFKTCFELILFTLKVKQKKKITNLQKYEQKKIGLAPPPLKCKLFLK